jgi:hypothetical protein
MELDITRWGEQRVASGPRAFQISLIAIQEGFATSTPTATLSILGDFGHSRTSAFGNRRRVAASAAARWASVNWLILISVTPRSAQKPDEAIQKIALALMHMAEGIEELRRAAVRELLQPNKSVTSWFLTTLPRPPVL